MLIYDSKAYSKSKFRLTLSQALLIAVVGIFISTPIMAAECYVAPDGIDVNPGSYTQPFATLIRARHAARDVVRKDLNEVEQTGVQAPWREKCDFAEILKTDGNLSVSDIFDRQ